MPDTASAAPALSQIKPPKPHNPTKYLRSGAAGQNGP